MKLTTIALATAFALSSAAAFAQSAGGTAGGSSTAGGPAATQPTHRWQHERQHHGWRNRHEERRHRDDDGSFAAFTARCQHLRSEYRRRGRQEG